MLANYIKPLIVSAYLSAFIGLGALLYIVDKVTREGLYQDAHHTRGAISASEFFIAGASLLLIGCSVLLFARIFKHYEATDGKKNITQQRMKLFALGSLTCAAAALLIASLAVFAVTLGLWAIVLSNREEQKIQEGVWIYRTVSMLAIAVSVVSVVLTFGTR